MASVVEMKMVNLCVKEVNIRMSLTVSVSD